MKMGCRKGRQRGMQVQRNRQRIRERESSGVVDLISFNTVRQTDKRTESARQEQREVWGVVLMGSIDWASVQGQWPCPWWPISCWLDDSQQEPSSPSTPPSCGPSLISAFHMVCCPSPTLPHPIQPSCTDSCTQFLPFILIPPHPTDSSPFLMPFIPFISHLHYQWQNSPNWTLSSFKIQRLHTSTLNDYSNPILAICF